MAASTTVIEKIKKILAKTIESGCTPEEAATAASMASKLMEQHQIDMADLVEKGEKILDPIAYEIFYQGQRVDSWIACLANSFAPAFCCVVVIAKGRGLGLYGRPDNREAFRVTFEYLKAAVHKGGTNCCPASIHGRTWVQSYGLGSAQKVFERATEERKALAAQAAAGNKNALMLIDEAGLVKRHVDDMNFKESGRNPQVNANAWRLGYADGDKLNLGSIPGRTEFKGYSLTA
jgi:hypothetical protein